MKYKVFGIIILLCINLCCFTNAKVKQAQIYQDNLRSILGKEISEVTKEIKKWDFKLSNSWEAENPNIDIIKKKNPVFSGFSNAEMEEIFNINGKYYVQHYMKKLETQVTSTGSIDQYGRSSFKDTDYTIDHFAVIRIVFRDKKLVNYKVWADLSNSTISGTRVIR